MNAKQLRVRFIDTPHSDGSIRAELETDLGNHHIYFRSNDITLTGNTEALLSATLLPCMRKGVDIVADGRVSHCFLNAIDTILDIFCTWEPSLQRVEIKNVIPERRKLPKENRVGTFFSAGMDSFYTFLKHRDDITDLIFVHGFDIRLDDYSLRRRTSEVIRKVGTSFGKRVIEVETNLGSFLQSSLHWRLAHGAALASVGHLLFPFFHRIYIPATHTYADLFPGGSHPVLDPLWSTETLEFVHDGCEATRIDKAALVSKFDVALNSLRVCWENRNGAYNCGQCEKCLRTMINLRAVGALDRCKTFDTQLDTKYILKIDASRGNRRAFISENLKALENRQGDQELCDALRKVLNRRRWQSPIITFLHRLKHRLLTALRKYPHIYQRLRIINNTLKGLTSGGLRLYSRTDSARYV